MPQHKLPSYRLHKATGQAVVVHKGRSYYLGKFGTPESRIAYDLVLTDILARRSSTASPPPTPPESAPPAAGAPLLVSELVLSYWQFATGYYVKNGRPTGELHPLRSALRLLRRHYGDLSVTTFGPLAIRELQQAMICEPVTRRVKVIGPDDIVTFETKVVRVGLSRRTINKQIGRIKRVFRWAVAEQLLAPDVYAAIREAPGLKKNRSSAREKPRVRPVAVENFEEALKRVPAAVAAMARVQWFSGCRPQEIVLMRARDIDRSSPVWEYRPPVYKTDHVNDNDDEALERVVFLGPRAQAEIAPLLAAARGGYLFRPGRPPRQRPTSAGGTEPCTRSPRKHYTVAGYRQEVQRGCRRAGVPVWSPNQLRHAAATRIRKEFGLEKVQAVLGHRELGVTQVYADVDRAGARAAMARLG
jgi:integrase